MMYPKILFKAYKNETVSKDVGMENADETTNVCRETTISDLDKYLSVQGGVEMNNATPLEGSSVILGEQNIVHDGEIFIQDHLTTVDFNNDEDQTSKSKEVEWNDDSDCGYGDNSEVENEFSDSSAKPSTKHIKKIKQEDAWEYHVSKV